MSTTVTLDDPDTTDIVGKRVKVVALDCCQGATLVGVVESYEWDREYETSEAWQEATITVEGGSCIKGNMRVWDVEILDG